MKSRGKGRTAFFWVILLVLGAAAAVYFGWFRPSVESPLAPDRRTAAPESGLEKHRSGPSETRPIPQPGVQQTPSEKEVAETGEPTEPKEADACERMERDVRAFFRYLDRQDYVKEQTGDSDAWTIFTRILAKLSSHPPIPAGEGMDPTVMSSNIYHLFRVLADRDIHLAREVLRHEAGSLELNMDLLYGWLTSGDRCPDPEGLRPSDEVLYRYAGFFMNTIGGRAYLSRRAARVRLLLSYYAVLILHRADLAGRNTDGIDVYPLVQQVKEEMALQHDFHFHGAYLEGLTAMEAHYAARR